MIIDFKNKKHAYWESEKIKAVYLGNKQVWKKSTKWTIQAEITVNPEYEFLFIRNIKQTPKDLDLTKIRRAYVHNSGVKGFYDISLDVMLRNGARYHIKKTDYHYLSYTESYIALVTVND